MSIWNRIATGAAVCTIAACSQSGRPVASSAPTANAHAAVMNTAGERIGMATLTQDVGGTVHVHLKVSGLTPGLHGVHIHAVGSCVAPTFASAGGHFNPQSKHHGLNNAAGPHAGALPNMTVDASGNAEYDARTSRISLTPGANSLFDADGSAIVVHATADDNMTDPAGNAGARVACGLIQSGTA